MGFTKKELIQFFQGLTELASEENKKEAAALIQMFMGDFERSYGYGKEAQTQISLHVRTLSEPMQNEIKKEISDKLKDMGLYSPENVERVMDSKLNDLADLIDTKKYEQIIREEEKKKASGQKRGAGR